MNAIDKLPRGVALPLDVEAEIVRLYQAGDQRQEIMDKTGVGRSTVSDVLNRNGVKLRTGKVLHSADKADLAVQMYKGGAERKEITEKTGIPNSTLTWILKRFGVDLTHVRRAGVPSERTQTICRLWEDGLSQRQIAETLGISTSAVAGVVYRKGLKRPDAVNRANLKHANQKRYPRPKPAPKPKLVAVASSDDTRVLMVPEAEAEKYAAREAATQILTAGEDPVLKLRALDCRWPIGEPSRPGFRFCCAIRPGAGPYCDERAKIAFQSPTRKQNAVRDIARDLRRYA